MINKWEKSSQNTVIWEQALKMENSLIRLPTISELRDAYYNKITGFKDGSYWTGESKENDKYNAWVFDFGVGRELYLVKSYLCYMRLILR